MQRANGVTIRQARAIENRWRQANKNLDGIGRGMAQSLIAPLTGISAALGAREVLQYADAWTKAKNSLAVAGVVGNEQSVVLDRIYESAQANSAPLGAMATLFGKAAQAGDNLGASQEDILKFTNGVGVALKVAGTSAEAAQGALVQLGQALGQSRVMAEEFNSVNEGARPILIAVANGLDAAGGSVNKLKQLVNDGKVSGQQFFQAFLKGLPSIQSMAANATQTIEQGVTKVNNAFTKYIGQTDESLSGSQRLIAGLNALADNFDATADVVLKVAGVIAGALVGRSIVGMIASLGLGVAALARFTAALRAAATMGGLATALGGLSAAAGPVGLVVGATVVGALALFSSSASTASAGANVYAASLKKVEDAAKSVAPAIDGASQSISNKLRNQLSGGIDEGVKKIEEAKAAVVDLFSNVIQNAPRKLVSESQLSELRALRDGLNDGSVSAKDASERLYALANGNANFQRLADQLSPLLSALANAIAATKSLKSELATAQPPSFRASENASMAAYDKMVAAGQQFLKDSERRAGLTKNELALEKEIAEVRKEALAAGVTLTNSQVKDLAGKRVAGDASRAAEGKAPKTIKASSDSRFDQDIQLIRDRTAALVEEQQMVGQGIAAQESRRLAIDMEQQALADLREEARRKGETDLASIQLAPEQVAAIQEVTDAYGLQVESLQKAQQAYGDINDIGRDVVGGLVSDFRNGTSAAESLANAVSRLGDKLADLALDSLFSPNGGGGGGLIGALFKGLSGGFADGGYTGPGAEQPAGVVHKGEYVFDADSVRSAGGPAALEAMRRGLKGYAAGGYVGSAPSLPRIPPRGGGGGVTFAPSTTIDARGSNMSEAQIQQMLDQRDRQILKQVPGVVNASRARTPSYQRT